jgi:hypothetical protein
MEKSKLEKETIEKIKKLEKDNLNLKKLAYKYEQQIKKMELKQRESARKDKRQAAEIIQLKQTLGKLQSIVRNR